MVVLYIVIKLYCKMESIIQKKLFNKDECDYLKSLSDDKSLKRSIGRATHTSIMIELNDDLSNILLPKFKEFQIKSLPDFFMILKYDINQEFKKHIDSGPEFPERYRTLVIQLSNETDYDGGELCIFENEKTTIPLKEIGNTIVFDSSLKHSTNKIKEGIRYSLVFWLSIHNFALNNKSLI